VLVYESVDRGDQSHENSRPGPDESHFGEGLVICVGIQDPVGVRVEPIHVANLPHVRSVQIRLRNSKDDKDRDEADQLQAHEPPHGLTSLLWPFSMDDMVAALLALARGLVLLLREALCETHGVRLC
jgi:hypothetical protein